MDTTSSSYSEALSTRMRAAAHELAARWLIRLQQTLPLEPQSIFPSEDILDHVTLLISEMASVLATADDDVAANSFVMTRARELGELRHRQGAYAHQLLREYELLRGILHMFVVEETDHLSHAPSVLIALQIMRRLDHAIGVLTSVTVDTFIPAYAETIDNRPNGWNDSIAWPVTNCANRSGSCRWPLAGLRIPPLTRRAAKERSWPLSETSRT